MTIHQKHTHTHPTFEIPPISYPENGEVVACLQLTHVKKLTQSYTYEGSNEDPEVQTNMFRSFQRIAAKICCFNIFQQMNHMGVSIVMRVPQNRGSIMEHPTKMDGLWKPPYVSLLTIPLHHCLP